MKSFLFALTLSGAVPVLAQVTPPVVAPAPTTTEAPFQSQIHLHTGQRFRTTLELTTKISENIPNPQSKVAMKIETSSLSRMVIDQNVLSSDASGYKIELVYQDMAQQTRITQDDKVVLDTSKPVKGMDFMTNIDKSIIGAKLGYTLSPIGKITDVTGTQAYYDRLFVGLGKTQTPQEQQMMKQFLTNFISPDALKGTLEKSFGALPDKPIALGESWTYDMKLPLGASFSPTITGKRTFSGRKNGLAVIDEKSTFSTDANQKMTLPLPAGNKSTPPSMYFAMTGVMTGQTLIDEATGFTSQSNSSQHLGGKMTLLLPGSKMPKASIPLYGLVEMKSSVTDISATP